MSQKLWTVKFPDLRVALVSAPNLNGVYDTIDEEEDVSGIIVEQYDGPIGFEFVPAWLDENALKLERSAVKRTDPFTDIEFRVRQSSFRAHRVVLLTSKCEYFEAILKSEQTVVELDHDPDAFSLLLDCLYTGTLEELDQEAAGLSYFFRAVNPAGEQFLADAAALSAPTAAPAPAPASDGRAKRGRKRKQTAGTADADDTAATTAANTTTTGASPLALKGYALQVANLYLLAEQINEPRIARMCLLRICATRFEPWMLPLAKFLIELPKENGLIQYWNSIFVRCADLVKEVKATPLDSLREEDKLVHRIVRAQLAAAPTHRVFFTHLNAFVNGTQGFEEEEVPSYRLGFQHLHLRRVADVTEVSSPLKLAKATPEFGRDMLEAISRATLPGVSDAVYDTDKSRRERFGDDSDDSDASDESDDDAIAVKNDELLRANVKSDLEDAAEKLQEEEEAKRQGAVPEGAALLLQAWGIAPNAANPMIPLVLQRLGF